MKKEIIIIFFTSLLTAFVAIASEVYSLKGRVDATDSYQKLMHQDLSDQIKELRSIILEKK